MLNAHGVMGLMCYLLYDLTIDEAFDLASRLTMAAQYARHLESMPPDGFDPLA